MRPTPCLALLAVLAIGCGKDTDDSSATDDTGPDTSDPLDRYIHPTDEAVGDFSCFTPGAAWLTQEVDAAKVVPRTLHAMVEDFEDNFGVNEADVEIWYGDTFSGTPDVTGSSDSAGSVDLEVPTCQALAYMTSTDPLEERTVDTQEAHQIYGYVEEGTLLEDDLNSVAQSTYTLIPSLLGVSLDDDKSVIAGTAYDCNGDPIQNAQVVVVDSAGDFPESLVTNYFIEEWPVREQPATSEDGLWVAMNVPEGAWTVQLWALIGGVEVLLGATELESFAGGINISNIYTGYGDGVYYPESCLAE
jgi:hypothetical protein